MTNAGVNVTYYSRLMTQVKRKMEGCKLAPGQPVNPDAYCTRLHPDHPDNQPIPADQPVFDTSKFVNSQFPVAAVGSSATTHTAVPEAAPEAHADSASRAGLSRCFTAALAPWTVPYTLF